MSTSFTYFEAEDRLLLVLQPGDHRLWLTRRLSYSILHDIAQLFARKVPGEGIPGAGSAEERIALEHQMAMAEEDLPSDSARGGPMQFSATPPARPGDAGITLCTGLDAQVGDDYCSLGFVYRDATVSLRLSRPGFHRFLRALYLCSDKAGWQVAGVPPWLTQSLLGSLLDNLPPTTSLDDNQD